MATTAYEFIIYEKLGRVARVTLNRPQKLNAISEELRAPRCPLEALAEHKYIVNRWFEIMGLPTAVTEGAEFDAIYHQTRPAQEFWRLVQERGLKAALEWRDSPFDDYRGARAQGEAERPERG